MINDMPSIHAATTDLNAAPPGGPSVASAGPPQESPERLPGAELGESPDTPAVATGAAEEPKKPDTKQWYVVKVQSGREESIKEAIERRVKIEGLEEYFGHIVITMDKVT